MSAHNTPIEITPSVYWVGTLDYDLRYFDLIMTANGTTYGSYLIKAQQPVLIDVTKYAFKDEYLTALGSVVDLSTIKYIVLNHTEPDHSGGLKKLLEIAKDATVVASSNSINNLNEIMGQEFKFIRLRTVIRWI